MSYRPLHGIRVGERRMNARIVCEPSQTGNDPRHEDSCRFCETSRKELHGNSGFDRN